MLTTADSNVARTILNEIEAGNYKKALNHVEKKLKKTDSNYFKALQALIKCHLGQVAEKGAVLTQLEELVAAKLVITDLDTIQFYDDALKLILPKPGESWARLIGYLRWELVKASPKDEEASKTCFKACLAQQDYEHARHITNSLEKNFPGKHEYVFWNIVTMFLYSRHPIFPEKERKLYGALAEGLICKLAEATVKAAGSAPLPLRCIHTAQELLLLGDILKSKSHKNMDAARLEFLQSPFLGPESAIAKGDWQLWRLKLELMRKTQSSEILQTTAELLRKARTKDEADRIVGSRFSDWDVWKLYIDAALSNKDRHKEAVETEVRAHLDPNSGVDKSWRRNAALALVKFGGSGNHILDYLQRYGDTNTAFVDLRQFVQDLDVPDIRLLLAAFLGQSSGQGKGSFYPLNQDVTTSTVRLVNIYKLVFLLSSSMPENIRWQSRELATCDRCSTLLSDMYCGTCLTELAWATIKSYGLALKTEQILAKTDRHPADDLCILSSMCLTKLSINGNSSTTKEPLKTPAIYYLLQAAVILEYGWSQSKPNSQMSLMLTRLYAILGCGSLAFRAFQRLSVKQIQYASLSYYMFDGISSLHPHPFPSENSSQERNVIEEFRGQQKIYKNSAKNINKQCWNAFEHSNYNKILELEDFKNALAYNMSVVMSVVESRKVSRLSQPNVPLTASSCGYDILPNDVADPNNTFFDTNDYDALPNFEKPGVGSPLGQVHGSRMEFSDFRTRMDLFTEKVLTMIDPVADSISTTSAGLWLNENIESIQAQIISRNASIHDGDIQHDLEDLRYTIYHKMAVILFRSKDLRLTEDLKEILGLVGRFKDFAPASQDGLHLLYTAYEIGTSVLKFEAYVARTGQVSGSSEDEFKLDADRLVKMVIEKSSAIKRSLDEGGWMDKVKESVGGDPDVEDTTSIPGILRSVIGEDFMEEWAGEVVESWKDSVKGFAYFKN